MKSSLREVVQMYSSRSPPWKKQTPTNNPDLLETWKELYNQLVAVYPKSSALLAVGETYGVSRQTVMYHLFPAYKESQKKRPSKKWSYEKQDPVIHTKRISYKARYMAARYHIDELIRQSYQRAGQETMTIEDLAYGIHDISNIFFKPSTIKGLANQFKETRGYPLLIKIPCHEVMHYKLSKKA